ncbi:NAD(P)-binding domain superfamily protein [Abortiporus biennis]
MSSAIRPVLIVAGVGSPSGTGAAAARLFAREGYRVALVARSAERLKITKDHINNTGGEAEAFSINDYEYSTITDLFSRVKSHTWPSPAKAEIRVAFWNASNAPFKTFLDITEEDIQETLQANVIAPFSFSRQAILNFKENEIDERGRRGTLIFTGATGSLRGNTYTSAFSAGKFGLRALSQSLAKEFGKDNIHVAQFIIDGMILSERTTEGKTLEELKDTRLNPESIAEAILYLTNQDKSAWTWELDLRPSHEKW